MKTLYILWHLGLGDAFICNGLVRAIVPQYDLIFVPCKQHNLASVKWMFADESKIVVLPVAHDHQAVHLSKRFDHDDGEVLKLGMFGRQPYGAVKSGWDREFYEQAGVSFEQRWKGFVCPNVTETRIYDEVFVHDDETRGFPINVKGYRPKGKQTPFHYLLEIQSATEIHCIDSCFAILADSIPTTGKLFLHRYARLSVPPIYRKNWTILEEPLK